MADIWARKSIDLLQRQAEGEHSEAAGTSTSLRRSLSLFSVTSLGIGALIGAGIFVLTGHAAAQYAGPAIVLSYIGAGFICIFAGLCYSEMAACCPVAGSAYTYAFATMGELVAWMIGWDLILEYAVGAVTVSIGWSGYVVSFLKDLGIIVPKAYSSAPFAFDPETHSWSTTGNVLNIPAMLIIAAISILLVIGVKESARVNNAIVVLKVAIVLLFIGMGIWFVKESNWVVPKTNPTGAFIPPNSGVFGIYGWSGILRGAAVVFFAYIGFDAVSTAAQECEHPQRNMPLGILLSLGICTVLYCLVSFTITGIVPFDQLNDPAPIAVGADRLGFIWLKPLIKLGAILGAVVGHAGAAARPEPRALLDGLRTGCCRRRRRRSTRASARPGSSRPSSAWWARSSPACCRSASSASWSRSGPCSPSSWSASAWWCCASASRRANGRSRRRRSSSPRRWARWARSSSWRACRPTPGSASASGS